MSAVRSCNNVDIDCVGRNLRCIEDYTRNNCFSLRPADTSLVSPSLRYFYHIPFGALLRRFESNRRPFSLSLSIAILNPFSSPEDEDWIGRVSSVELSGEEERERKNVCERNLGNVASVRSRLFFWSEKSRIYTRNLSIQEFWRNCPFVIIKKMWICNHSVTLSRNFISYKFVFRKAKNWTLKKRRIAILFSRNLSEERQAR